MPKAQDKARHSIKNMCKVLNISEAGYYKWLRRQSYPYKYDELLAKIRQIRAENPDYGGEVNTFSDSLLSH
jgi:putative transposase